jgi:hypothetical protein
MGEGASRTSQFVFRLYDGTTVLSEYSTQDSVVFFRSAESSFSSGSSDYPLNSSAGVVSSYRSIVDGTIDGRIDFSVTSGSVEVTGLETARVQLMGKFNSAFYPTIPAQTTGRELCH